MLDKILQAVAIGQTFVTTMRAGSRAFYILKDGEIGIMKGPLILPPGTNETSELFDLSEAFRDAVAFGNSAEHFCSHDAEPSRDTEADSLILFEDSTDDVDGEDIGNADVVDDEVVERFLLEAENVERKPLSWASK